MTYGLILIPAEGYYQYFINGRMLSWQSSEFWSEAIRCLLLGLFFGYVQWAHMESEYKKVKSGQAPRVYSNG